MRMRLAFVVLAGLSVLPSPASADQLQDVKARGKLICGTLATVVPLGFQDPKTREIVGFDVDTCAAIAKRLGVTLEQHSVTTEARIPEVTVGRVDIIAAALGFTNERAKLIDYTAAHYQTANRIMVLSASGVTNLSELEGQKISATKGGTPEIAVRARIPSATLLTFQDPPSAFLALRQSKVKGFAVSEFGALQFKADAGSEVAFIEEPLNWEATGLGIRKGEPAFLAEVNRILQEMEKEGELDRIWNKWYGPETPYKITRVQAQLVDELEADFLGEHVANGVEVARVEALDISHEQRPLRDPKGRSSVSLRLACELAQPRAPTMQGRLHGRDRALRDRGNLTQRIAEHVHQNDA
jgi:polar amino acid transport system substrate-binding protein